MDDSALKQLDYRIGALETRLREIGVGVGGKVGGIGPVANFSAGSCTNNCTAACTIGCTQGCTKGCVADPGDRFVLPQATAMAALSERDAVETFNRLAGR